MLVITQVKEEICCVVMSYCPTDWSVVRTTKLDLFTEGRQQSTAEFVGLMSISGQAVRKGC